MTVIVVETTSPVSKPSIAASFQMRACIDYYRNREYSVDHKSSSMAYESIIS